VFLIIGRIFLHDNCNKGKDKADSNVDNMKPKEVQIVGTSIYKTFPYYYQSLWSTLFKITMTILLQSNAPEDCSDYASLTAWAISCDYERSNWPDTAEKCYNNALALDASSSRPLYYFGAPCHNIQFR
jgi:hypothetical protein